MNKNLFPNTVEENTLYKMIEQMKDSKQIPLFAEEIKKFINDDIKEDFITTESYYYTIHKNDNLPLNVKVPLLCMCFRILRRKPIIFFQEI